MAISIALLPQGTRVQVKRASLPQDPAVTGRTGTVVVTSDYAPQSLGVVLDGDQEVRTFTPGELEVVEELALAPEREQARDRRALP